jgi:hypothetical protein
MKKVFAILLSIFVVMPLVWLGLIVQPLYRLITDHEFWKNQLDTKKIEIVLRSLLEFDSGQGQATLELEGYRFDAKAFNKALLESIEQGSLEKPLSVVIEDSKSLFEKSAILPDSYTIDLAALRDNLQKSIPRFSKVYVSLVPEQEGLRLGAILESGDFTKRPSDKQRYQEQLQKILEIAVDAMPDTYTIDLSHTSDARNAFTLVRDFASILSTARYYIWGAAIFLLFIIAFLNGPQMSSRCVGIGMTILLPSLFTLLAGGIVLLSVQSVNKTLVLFSGLTINKIPLALDDFLKGLFSGLGAELLFPSIIGFFVSLALFTTAAGLKKGESLAR